jgi:hypothetical protein
VSPCSGENYSIGALSIELELVPTEKVPPEDGDIIQSPKRRVLNKNRTIDNVQKHNNCINTPSSGLK